MAESKSKKGTKPSKLSLVAELPKTEKNGVKQDVETPRPVCCNPSHLVSKSVADIRGEREAAKAAKDAEKLAAKQAKAVATPKRDHPALTKVENPVKKSLKAVKREKAQL